MVASSRSRAVGRDVARAEVVVRDGVELPEEQSRALWRAFREHLAHTPEDLDGFARAHGFTDARAETRRGRTVLRLESAIESATPRRSPGPARARPSASIPPSSPRAATARPPRGR